MRQRYLASLVTLGCMLVPVQAAAPCSCISFPPRGWNALISYRYVLVGKVVGVHWDGPRGSFVVEPIRVWKGKWPGDEKRFRLTTLGNGASCGYPLAEGDFYIIYASEEPQHMRLCDHEPLPLEFALEEVAILDKARHYPPLVVPDEALVPPKGRR